MGVFDALRRRAAAAPVPVDAAINQQMQPSSPFSPGTPIHPYAGYRGEPRSFDFQTGYNITARPERGRRVSFKVLRELTDCYDVARMAIGHRIDDVRSLDWSLQPADGVDSDMDDAIQWATRIMQRPDRVHPFRTWLAMYLEDVLRYDAGVLYRRRDRAGRVCALEVVSGSTIAPLIDYYGRRPEPPASAYVQYVNGTPFKWLTTADLIYEPFRPQPDSPYGFAPLEAVLLAANTDIRFQQHFLTYFTAGTIPAGFASMPADVTTPEQLAKWQAYWDDLLYGDDAAKHQLRFVPNGTTFNWPKDAKFDPQFPLYLMRKVAAAFHVTPNDLGFTEDVNRATGDTQVDVQFRVGTLPLVQHVQGILTDYLRLDLGVPLDFVFDTGQEKEDRLVTAQADQIYINSGVVSPDEVRQRVYGLPTDATNPVPRYVFATRVGPIPLTNLFNAAGPIDPDTLAPVKGQPTKAFTAIPGSAVSEKPAVAATNPESLSDPGDAPNDPADPLTKAGLCGGLAVQAVDTGRVLLIQRSNTDPDDPAAGMWEFPGGHAEPGEDAWQAAVREWQEETGTQLPFGVPGPAWTGPGGMWRGHVWQVPYEADVQINAQTGRVLNPDDPDGDDIEVAAWWDVDDLPGNPALRPEMAATPWQLIRPEGRAPAEDIAKELRRWRDNSRSRVNRGQPPKLFTSAVLPATTTADVWRRLATATDRAGVDAAFGQVGAGPKG